MRDVQFKYRPGERVTHRGFLEPTHQSVVPQFEIVTQMLEAVPGGPRRYYYIRSVENAGAKPGTTRTGFRVQEKHLAPLPVDM